MTAWDRRTPPPLAAAMIVQAEQGKLQAFWDSVGRKWTIGNGFTSYLNGKPVRSGDVISPQQNAAMMAARLGEYTGAIASAITAPMTASFAAALYDFCHNDGPGRLDSSMIAKMGNAGDWAAAGNQLNGWAMSGGKVDLGLLRRCEYRRRLAMGESTDPEAVYDSVWMLGAVSLMPLYNRAFAEARAWGWTGSASPAPPITTALHAGSSATALAKPHPTASAQQSTADALNEAEIATINTRSLTP